MSETFWKTVVAEYEVPPDQVAASLDAAMTAGGFRGPAPRYIRFQWLLLIPTHFERRTEIWTGNGATYLSVRFGLATGWAYYLIFLILLAGAIFLPLLTIDQHDWAVPVFSLVGLLFLLPVAHGIAVRLVSRQHEKALWQALSALGPQRAGRTIRRNLNYAYGEDRVIEHRPPEARS